MNGKTSWSINTLISPALLRTCRTIYSEASSILYTENVFLMMDPQDMIAFLKKIGSTNTKYLKYLRLWVFPGLLYPWLKLLDNLAHKVTRLRKIEIVFIPDRLQPGARWKKRGLGDNEYFVRALAKIQGLSELEIRGYYAQHWLAYMEKNMGVSVHAKIGFFEKPSRYDVKAFKQYQQDLGDLTLWLLGVPRTDKLDWWGCEILGALSS